MTSENDFKQCLQLIINTVSDTIKNLQGQKNDQQILNDLRIKLKNILEKSLSTLSTQCRNYLLNLLYQYKYNDQDKTLSNLFTKPMLNSFLHDLQGRLLSLDVFQAAWNGDQTIVKNFIDNYPTLKDQSGLYETTLLYSAARNNHLNLVKYLIEIGHCSVNVQNEEYQESTMKATIGSTPLHAACFQGHLSIVIYLIEHGGDYFILNNVHETPVQNGKSNIRKFFKNFLIFNNSSKILPNKTILQEIQINNKPIIDCIWEYKPLTLDQWYPFATDLSNQLQQTLINKDFKNDIQLKTGRDIFNISITQFSRIGKNNSQAWIRCRGSSLLNFHCYSQWQIMFIKHPTGTSNSSPSLQIFNTITNNIQLNSWYTVDNQTNLLFETAMNYRRRYLNINLINNKITFDLENFEFNNQQNTIDGFLRWIPKTIVGSTDELKYENVFHHDDLNFSIKKSIDENEISKLVHVIRGDLLAEKVDVIVVCSLSKYLVESVFKIGGDSVKQAFNMKVKKNETELVISVPADGQLASKAVYFVPWKPNPDPKILCQSIQQLVNNVIDKATSEHYTSIAFPAIGCGEYGCPISLVAQTFAQQVQKQLMNHQLMVLFVIQPEKMDIYEEFRQQVALLTHKEDSSISIGKGIIEVEKGDITKQTVDVIIGSSSSENLKQVLLKAGGDEVEQAYITEHKNNPNSLLLLTPPGQLHCKRIFFLKWEPNNDQQILRQSLIDLIANVIQNVLSYNFTSIAFPALGCGEHACSVDIVVKTMVKEMKKQIQQRKLPWTVKFIIYPNQENVYDEFCKQLLSSDYASNDYQIPSTWERSDDDDKLLFIVPINTNEYKSIISKFDEAMKGQYKEIVKLERIQNERWYMQYIAHSNDFKKRLNEDTEKRLYHGCPEDAAHSIMQDCFNRSFAGVNGTAYGVGVYFSSDATYSYGYTRLNSKGERCMFVARVLVGKSTLGNSSMKTRPLGFDSTTDGKHITVTYHDAQAYAEYLITFK